MLYNSLFPHFCHSPLYFTDPSALRAAHGDRCFFPMHRTASVSSSQSSNDRHSSSFHHQCCSRHPWACVIRDNVGVLWAADQGQICRPQLCCTQASYPGYISQWFYQSYMRSLKSRFFANTWPHAIPMSTFGLTHVVRIYISLIANELEGFERCLLTLWVFSSLNRLTATFASLFNWDWIFFV